MAGPNPTFAQAWTQFGTIVNVINALEQFGNATSPNWLDLEDTAITGIDGVYTPRSLTILRQLRAGISAPLRTETLRALFRPCLQEICRAADLPEAEGASDRDMLAAIRQYMVDNSQTINSRGMTLDTSVTAVGSPTGDGVIRRCTVDKDANVLECTGPEVKRFECVRDQTSGTKRHEEVFKYSTTAPDAALGGLQWGGSGVSNPNALRVAHARSSRILKNGSFDTNSASSDASAPSSTTSITNWTITTSTSNWSLRNTAATNYRDYPGAPSTQWSLEITGDDTITQVFRTASPGAGFRDDVPYLCRVAWQRLSSATGNLNLTLGSQTATATIGSGTNGQWNHLILPLDENAYYANFAQDSLSLAISVDTLATGTVVIDDVILVPCTNLDGTFWVLDGGDTAWLNGNGSAYYTFTDSDGTRAKFSYWLWRAYGADGWLPSDNAAGETIADPS